MLDTQVPTKADYCESLSVKVITRDLQGNIESVRTIDYEERDDRVWLGKHCYWAMRNGRSVETRPL